MPHFLKWKSGISFGEMTSFGKINLGPTFFYSRYAVVLNYSIEVGSFPKI
jgi:hypothetical protein